MSKIKQIIEDLKVIRLDEIGNVERICDGSTGTIYKLKNASEPIAIKCVKNVSILKEFVMKE